VSAVDTAVEAIRGGRLAVVPTDTVYGLATTAYSEDAVRGLYQAKGRDELTPTALVAAGLGVLLECIPELEGRALTIARTLLPGPFTLILPNPASRFRWLTGSSPETIGVRVPELAGPGSEVLARVGAIAATSANLPGGPDPRTLDAVPPELRAAAHALVDGGELPGTPSTVIDFTGSDPVVLREGAASAAEALRAVGLVL
jgi:L-threonylcarbamoyladenylate synthase